MAACSGPGAPRGPRPRDRPLRPHRRRAADRDVRPRRRAERADRHRRYRPGALTPGSLEGPDGRSRPAPDFTARPQQPGALTLPTPQVPTWCPGPEPFARLPRVRGRDTPWRGSAYGVSLPADCAGPAKRRRNTGTYAARGYRSPVSSTSNSRTPSLCGRWSGRSGRCGRGRVRGSSPGRRRAQRLTRSDRSSEQCGPLRGRRTIVGVASADNELQIGRVGGCGRRRRGSGRYCGSRHPRLGIEQPEPEDQRRPGQSRGPRHPPTVPVRPPTMTRTTTRPTHSSNRSTTSRWVDVAVGLLIEVHPIERGGDDDEGERTTSGTSRRVRGSPGSVRRDLRAATATTTRVSRLATVSWPSPGGRTRHTSGRSSSDVVVSRQPRRRLGGDEQSVCRDDPHGHCHSHATRVGRPGGEVRAASGIGFERR